MDVLFVFALWVVLWCVSFTSFLCLLMVLLPCGIFSGLDKMFLFLCARFVGVVDAAKFYSLLLRRPYVSSNNSTITCMWLSWLS